MIFWRLIRNVFVLHVVLKTGMKKFVTVLNLLRKQAQHLNQSTNQFFIISCHTATNTSIMQYVGKVQQD